MEDNFDIKKLHKKNTRKNSKAKGNRFQNDVCKAFNQKFNTKKFSSSPGSGAYATTHDLPEHLIIYGDIIAPEWFPFIVECKKGYNKESLHSILNTNSIIHEWIEQVERDATKGKRKPLLVIKQDYQPIICVTIRDLNYPISTFIEDFYSYIIFGNKKYIMFYFEDLLKIPDPLFIK